MDAIVSAAALITQGLTRGEIRTLVRTGTLCPIRRGAYLLGPLDPDEDDPGGYLSHRRMIEATLPQLQPDAVLCQGSAAVLHELPVWRHSVTTVHIMRDGNAGGQTRAHVHVHRTPLADDEITVIDGHAVTTLARTVADLGRSAPKMESVAVGDAALRMGLDPVELRHVLASMYRWPGVRNARWMADFLDGRSESPGESASRVRMVQDGVPQPELQREIFDEDGVFVARVDFAWEKRRTVGEFDGQIKYGRLLKPGQDASDAVFREKVREDAVRDEGWGVVRWVWSDLRRPDRLAARVRRRFR